MIKVDAGGTQGRLNAVVHVKFVENGRYVRLHRGFGNVEFVRNLFIRLTLSNTFKYQ